MVHMLGKSDAPMTLCGLPTAGSASPPITGDREFCLDCEDNSDEGRAYQIVALAPEVQAAAGAGRRALA